MSPQTAGAEICDDQPGVGAGFPFPTDVGVPKFWRRVQLCPGPSHFPTLFIPQALG